jgi:hypothetical protein
MSKQQSTISANIGPGVAVELVKDIITSNISIPRGTLGIVQWSYPRVARVQFVGYLSLYGVEVEKLKVVILQAVAS